MWRQIGQQRPSDSVQVILKPLKIMPVLNEGGLTQTAFPPEKIEEAGNLIREWLR